MTKHTALLILRLAFGLLSLTAIGTQLAIHIRNDFSLVNFFSFFTNLSNLLAAIVLLLGAFYLIMRRSPSALNDLIRGSTAINMTVVGIVYVLLLRNVDLGALLPWVNTVLHYVMPIAVVGEWLIQPPASKLGTRQLLICMVFPMLYLAYVLIRGAVVSWYPYPFLNPATAGGYAGVGAYVIAIIALFLLAGWALLALSHQLQKQTTNQAAKTA